MPGILPMKVIKMGTSSQNRVAQACDRCRSKKIRCDGITPCCTQCANVGFDCKTSDKLSRRAFPRGYTESLEERVRSLESEVKDLKDLLDAKDEKIDMLSKMHSQQLAFRRPSTPLSWSTPDTSRTNSVDAPSKGKSTSTESQDVWTNEGDVVQEKLYAAASTGKPLIDAFQKKMQKIPKQAPPFDSQVFFTSANSKSQVASPTSSNTGWVPSRMAADHYINVFFQEWAPLLPILHRPTILKFYSQFSADPESLSDKHVICQLQLIFGIASHSTKWDHAVEPPVQSQWQQALEDVIKESSVPTVQCLVLAQTLCLLTKDYERLRKYKAITLRFSKRLGLHQRQNRPSLNQFASELRRRVFWSFYTVDCFSAASIGQTMALEDSDIKCEYPLNISDDIPDADPSTKTVAPDADRLLNASSLVHGSRILAKVLNRLYPAHASSQLPLRSVTALQEELDRWIASIPSGLRLQFVQDKPSTNVVSSRSPFLALAYHYIRLLIHRPLAASRNSSRYSASLVAVAESSKHIIQILQLLTERGMSYSFCVNKSHLLVSAGFGLLSQMIDLDRRGKLIQDSERLLASVIRMLEDENAPDGKEFKNIAQAAIYAHASNRLGDSARHAMEDRRKSDSLMAMKGAEMRRQLGFSVPHDKSTLSLSESNIEHLGGRPTSQPSPFENFTNIAMLHVKQEDGGAAASLEKGHVPAEDAAQLGLDMAQINPFDLNLDFLDFNNDPPALSNMTSPTMNESLQTSTEDVDSRKPFLDNGSIGNGAVSGMFSYLADGTPTSQAAHESLPTLIDSNSSNTPVDFGFTEDDFASVGEELMNSELMGQLGTNGIRAE